MLDRLDSAGDRDWYAGQAAEYGWSRAVLEHQIAGRLRTRVGAAPTNFAASLPPVDSELARQLVRDPYLFDHLGLTGRVAEHHLEQALMDRLQATPLAFGSGMAFLGRQVRFDVGDGEDLVVDLLLFHIGQLRYVVVELKIGRFEPGHAGQLGTYVALVEDRLRRPAHAPTIGLLLVTGRNQNTVRYALSATTAPLAVADYTYDTLPPDARAVLPPADTLTAALDTTTLTGRRHEETGDDPVAHPGGDEEHGVEGGAPDETPSPDEVEAARTPAGAWTRETLRGWGVPWPPPTGWRHDLLVKW